MLPQKEEAPKEQALRERQEMAADPNNEEHCDFLRLKDAVFGDWRGELREASREQWYEGWRTSRLNHRDRNRGTARR